jgi:hypothetical protein
VADDMLLAQRRRRGRRVPGDARRQMKIFQTDHKISRARRGDDGGGRALLLIRLD